MKKIKIMTLIFPISLLLSCTKGDNSKNMDLELISVKVGDQKPHKDCLDLGPVVGTSYGISKDAYRASMRDLKIQALGEGSNFVRIQSSTKNGRIVNGTAYKCPPKEVEEEA